MLMAVWSAISYFQQAAYLTETEFIIFKIYDYPFLLATLPSAKLPNLISEGLLPEFLV